MADVKKVSEYIIAFAGAARVAQAAMSTGTVPMAIKEYRFQVNLASEVSIESNTDIGLTVSGIKIEQKLMLGYTSSMGVEIECTIVPQVTILGG